MLAFEVGYVPSVIIEAGDAVTTANNLLANKALVNMRIFGDVVVMLVESMDVETGLRRHLTLDAILESQDRSLQTFAKRC